jgi:PTS hybrid protein
MIGIVVVSHSPALARATVELALEMVGDTPPSIAIAAGAGEGVTGTDAVKVAEAIDQVASGDGVLVFMDLGSAVLSGTMATEFMSTNDEVRLTDAPFVEGLVAAVVLANAGSSLDEVDREARSAMGAKQSQLVGYGNATASAPVTGPADALPTSRSTEPAGADSAAAGGEATAEVPLINRDGLHSRPAAAIVQALAKIDAKVVIADITSGTGPVAANSLIGIMSLGATKDHVVRFSATGPAAHDAIDLLLAMTAEGFGELEN